MDKFCEWEWVSTSAGVVQTGCSVEGAVLVGNYSYHECGIQVTVGPGHRGVWLCEIEKYHAGFGRRWVLVKLLLIHFRTNDYSVETRITNNVPYFDCHFHRSVMKFHHQRCESPFHGDT